MQNRDLGPGPAQAMVRLSGALSGARRRVPTWKRGYDSNDDGLSPSPPPPEQRGAVGSSTLHQHISPLGPRRAGERNGLAVPSGNLRESISALGRANRAALDKVDKVLRGESFNAVEFESTHPIWSASPRGAERVEATAADSVRAETEEAQKTEASPKALLRLLVSQGRHAGSLFPFRTLLRMFMTDAQERAFGFWKIRARVKLQVLSAGGVALSSLGACSCCMMHALKSLNPSVRRLHLGNGQGREDAAAAGESQSI